MMNNRSQVRATYRSRQQTLHRVRQYLVEEQQELSQVETQIFNSSSLKNMINVSKEHKNNESGNQNIDLSQERAIDLCGYWMGNYGDNGYEIIQIKRMDQKYVAVKVTGDKNVPGGEVSFFIDSPPFVSVGKACTGYIQVAHIGFSRPRFTEGELCLLSPNTFIFQWNNVRRRFERFNPHPHRLIHQSPNNQDLSLPMRTVLSSATPISCPQELSSNNYALDDDDEFFFKQ
jgi:hypothetical protein